LAILLKLQKKISAGVFLAKKHQKSRIFGPFRAKKNPKWPDFLHQPPETQKNLLKPPENHPGTQKNVKNNLY